MCALATPLSSNHSATPGPERSGAVDPQAWQVWIGNEEACRQLLDTIADGFLALDLNGRVMLANASARRIMEMTTEQLSGRRLEEIFPGIGLDQSPTPAAQVRLPGVIFGLGQADRHTDEQTNKQLLPVYLGGEARQFEFSIHSHPHGTGVLFRDVSEWIKHEMEIAKLNATMAASQELLRRKNEEQNASLGQLATLNEQLTKADELKGEFLANTSHELRTPLNSIIGFLQLIDEGLCEDEAERSHYTKNALISARHLLSLINDLLDITKIEAGKMTFLIENHQVEDLFQEVYSLTHVQAQQKGLKLEFDLPVDGLRLHADIHKCVQVMVNLVGNAIKFTDAGGIKAWAEIDPTRPDMLLIVVQDSGIGVPVHQQQAIFEKFKQADGTSTRRYQGTGLGLAITKNLVEMMGGTIWLHSPGEGLGTTVYFTIPMPNEGVDLNGTDELDHSDIDELLPDTF